MVFKTVERYGDSGKAAVTAISNTLYENFTSALDIISRGRRVKYDGRTLKLIKVSDLLDRVFGCSGLSGTSFQKVFNQLDEPHTLNKFVRRALINWVIQFYMSHVMVLSDKHEESTTRDQTDSMLLQSVAE